MRVVLVEPRRSLKYYTTYPPLGLLKLGAYHKKKRDQVRLARGLDGDGFVPHRIYVTSLFTYAWEPVHEVLRFYTRKYPRARVIVGGIYATLCPDHLRDAFGDRIQIHQGLFREIDDVLPDYSLVPGWNASIIFSSRGCKRRCPFCSVQVLEPRFSSRKSIRKFVYPGHDRIVFWDNNILASRHWSAIFDELRELDLEVDFNQGLDARLLTENVALELKELKLPIVRLAYDTPAIRDPLKKAIQLLNDVGVRGRNMAVYCLYNYETDDPESFLARIKDLLDWGVVAYPMRYEPLEPTQKNTYVASGWSAEQLEMIAKARRVIGYGGAFPPYEGLKKKILKAKTFERAFKLRKAKR